MISEKQLKAWERLCNKDSLCMPQCECFGIVTPVQVQKLTYEFADKAMEIIPQLIARVRELEKQLETTAMVGVFMGASEANDKIRQLEKEADWLVAVNGGRLGCPSAKVAMNCKDEVCSNGSMVRCWREAAKEAVKRDTE